MNHLNSASSHLSSGFATNWANSFSSTITDDDITNPQNVLNAEVAILAVLDGLANLFFKDLNFSVISGEYVQDIPLARTKLDIIENQLTSAAQFYIPHLPNTLFVFQETYQSGFMHPIRKSLKNYRLLLDDVERHLNYKPGTTTIFHLIKNDDDIGKKITSNAQTMSVLFGLNIEIAKADHTIAYNRKKFRSILMLKHRLSLSQTPGAVLDILIQKCNFLLYKLSFRLQQNKEKFDYAIDFQYASVQLVEVSEFKKFNNIIKGHYDEGVNPTEFDARLNNAKRKFNTSNNLTLDEYHALIKYYKDEVGEIHNLKKLDEAYGQFHSTLSSAWLSTFDKKAYDIGYCYIENNILSLELQKRLFTLDNWEEKIKKYIDRAVLADNSNFFPYYKIIGEFLIPQIKELFKVKDLEALQKIKGLIQKFEEYLKKLIQNISVCEEIDYLAYQSDFNNAILSVKDSSGQAHDCFISSSFALPLDYIKYREDAEEFKSELYKFRTMYDVQKLTQEDHKDIQMMKAEIDKTDKRHIEILSIFAALVMFVSNEIQIFSKITNMKDAVSYTLFFAYGLGLFVLMIWFITRPEGLRRSSFSLMHIFIVVLFLAGFGSGLWYVNKKVPVPSAHITVIEKLNYKIDSLKKQRTIDSLKLPRTRITKKRK